MRGPVGSQFLMAVAHYDSKYSVSKRTYGIIHRAFVQVLNTILLGNDGGRKVVYNHVKEGLSGRQPLLHDGLEEGLGVEILLVGCELNSQRFDHLSVLVLLTVHDGVEQLVDGLQDELDETSLAAGDGGLRPLTGLRVEVVITPQVLQHLVAGLLLGILRGLTLLGGRLHLGGVHVGELGKSKTPVVEARTEGNSSLVGVHGDITEEFILVGGNDDVNSFDGSLESLEKLTSIAQHNVPCRHPQGPIEAPRRYDPSC